MSFGREKPFCGHAVKLAVGPAQTLNAIKVARTQSAIHGNDRNFSISFGQCTMTTLEMVYYVNDEQRWQVIVNSYCCQ